MTAYYNEIDDYAADWLENLIAEGLIAPGVVDRRDIRDVRPTDLVGFTQCHFFAGIGVWSYALRSAGWPDDRPVWTGSCPCQPFSAAGKGDGFDDERHLWPFWHHLIRIGRPPKVFGEQVASKDGLAWLDLVQDDMEGEGYPFWPVDLCAAGVGAPHIRQRLWFVAEELADDDDDGFAASPFSGFRDAPHHVESCGRVVALADLRGERRQRWQGAENGCVDDRENAGWQQSHDGPVGFGESGPYRLDHHHHQGSQGHAGDGDRGGGWPGAARPASEAGVSGGLPHAAIGGRGEERQNDRGRAISDSAQGHPAGLVSARTSRIERPGPTNGIWRDADWLLCRDGKWRPVRPGTFPLAHGAASRVGRLRAYGNAIVAEAAREFIETFLEHEEDVAANGAAGGLSLIG